MIEIQLDDKKLRGAFVDVGDEIVSANERDVLWCPISRRLVEEMTDWSEPVEFYFHKRGGQLVDIEFRTVSRSDDDDARARLRRRISGGDA